MIYMKITGFRMYVCYFLVLWAGTFPKRVDNVTCYIRHLITWWAHNRMCATLYWEFTNWQERSSLFQCIQCYMSCVGNRMYIKIQPRVEDKSPQKMSRKCIYAKGVVKQRGCGVNTQCWCLVAVLYRAFLSSKACMRHQHCLGCQSRDTAEGLDGPPSPGPCSTFQGWSDPPLSPEGKNWGEKANVEQPREGDFLQRGSSSASINRKGKQWSSSNLHFQIPMRSDICSSSRTKGPGFLPYSGMFFVV